MNPEWISAAIATLAFLASAVSTVLVLKVRVMLAEFIDKLDGRYLRKPEHEDDYPVTRREIHLMKGFPK